MLSPREFFFFLSFLGFGLICFSIYEIIPPSPFGYAFRMIATQEGRGANDTDECDAYVNACVR